MKLLDWPPLWTAGFLIAIWVLDQLFPFGLFGAAGPVVGGVFLLSGVVLMLLAVRQMATAKTTVIPRSTPVALVTGGVFSISRNPIYLGDALVILASIFWWDVPLALPLVAVFMGIIQTRFIRDEERRLQSGFGADYAQWATKVRRWI